MTGANEWDGAGQPGAGGSAADRGPQGAPRSRSSRPRGAPASAGSDLHVGRLELIRRNDRRYARFPRLAALAGFAHAYSTRPDDVSARSDERAPQRTARRARMADDLGFAPGRLVHALQIHEPRVACIEEHSPGGPREACDGLFTAVPGVPLMTFSADCPLILLIDPRRRAVGMVHASWRCTVAKVVRVLIDQMHAQLACRAEDLLAGIGPSAGPEHYEVKHDVYDAAAALDEPGSPSAPHDGYSPAAPPGRTHQPCGANEPRAAHQTRGRERFFPRSGDGRMMFDMWAANRAQLLDAGVRAENIEIAGACTMTHTDVFYSFRREGAGCGHFGLMAGLLGSA